MNAALSRAPEQVLLAEGLTPGHLRQSLIQETTPNVPQTGRHAAVAMILIGTPRAKELLFIRRADYQGDPWSGDVAFPGGSVEQRDRDTRATAERETREEINLSLPSASYLGTLGSINGAYLTVSIACHVYQLATLPKLTLNGEVVRTFCVPLPVLLERQRNRQQSFEYRGQCHVHPVIDLEGYCERLLWGISYRLVKKFFTTLGVDTLL